MKTVIETMLIAMPVYRTYGRPNGEISEHDRAVIEQVTKAAIAVRPDIDVRLFELVRDVLIGTLRGDAETEAKLRFQQASGPIMAKGVEDTAFYTYQRFIACNEVGSDPEHFGVTVDEFHAYNERKQAVWPTAMLGTSTHDTKRSEDVRARLAVLSEVADTWAEKARRWMAKRPPDVDSGIAYHLLQTLVGAWPIDGERIRRYLEKAMREAKEHTSWTRIDETYENAVQTFAKSLLEDKTFTSELSAFVETIRKRGEDNALAQKVLTLTSPGVPDIYQGTELFDFSLTDPDNRRAVDFEKRIALLDTRTEPKLWLTQRLLHLRLANPECFDERATYEPVRGKNAIAYIRGSKASATRILVIARQSGFTDITLPPGNWRDALNDEAALHHGKVRAEALLRDLPVAVLTNA
jgi:(1->4)-alpha-D-glucan 1-alpha-D-glucosylmutase